MRFNNERGKTTTLIAVIVIVVAVGVWFLVKGRGAMPGPRVEMAEEVNLSGTLASALPPDTFGFLFFDFQHPAFQRYLSSPWAARNRKGGSPGIESVVTSAISSQAQGARLMVALKEAGFDLADQREMVKKFSKLVLFVAGKIGPNVKPAFGALCQASSAADLTAQMNGVKEAFEKSGYHVENFGVSTGSGFVVEGNDPVPSNTADAVPTEPVKTYFGIRGDRLVISGEPERIDDLLGAQGDRLEIIKDGQFKRITSGLAKQSDRYGVWYADFRSVTDLIAKNSNAQGEDKLASQAFLGAGGSFAMGETPAVDLRLGYDKTNQLADRLVKGISAGTSDEISRAYTSLPMTFVSVDGTVLKSARDYIAAEHKEDSAEIISQLDNFSNVSRLALGIKVAPVGTSILPIPDIIFAATGQKISETREKIITLANSMMKFEQSQKKIAGQDVSVLRGPGVGILVAEAGNILIATTSESQMEKFLGNPGGKSNQFVASVVGRGSDLLFGEPSLTNLYLNFGELGTFLENMGGMLSMYAPQSQETKALLDKENLSQLKNLGSLSAAVSLDTNQGLLRLESVYGTSGTPAS